MDGGVSVVHVRKAPDDRNFDGIRKGEPGVTL
ncbi:MAG: hypothetical protein GHHEDOFH_00560 [Pseudorhodoplanes sp.]|nr:hypothetical protein [Pseudorhodoplanes sp.]